MQGISPKGSERQTPTQPGHTGKCLLRDRIPEKQPFRINDQAQLRTAREAGWPSATAPLGVTAPPRNRLLYGRHIQAMTLHVTAIFETLVFDEGLHLEWQCGGLNLLAPFFRQQDASRR